MLQMVQLIIAFLSLAAPCLQLFIKLLQSLLQLFNSFIALFNNLLPLDAISPLMRLQHASKCRDLRVLLLQLEGLLLELPIALLHLVQHLIEAAVAVLQLDLQLFDLLVPLLQRQAQEIELLLQVVVEVMGSPVGLQHLVPQLAGTLLARALLARGRPGFPALPGLHVWCGELLPQSIALRGHLVELSPQVLWNRPRRGGGLAVGHWVRLTFRHTAPGAAAWW
mmetsp:Transcript_25543/g.72149  ORF Transcript_25543/g.72149 Transcript_25543/m.72149 type:complete len:223 (-) Transcript_25543:43-711(-)